MNKCINCSHKFTAERSTAKFCSNKCKLQYKRKKLSGSKSELSGSNKDTNDTLTSKSPYKVWITDPKQCKEDPYKVWHLDFDYEPDYQGMQNRINKERDYKKYHKI